MIRRAEAKDFNRIYDLICILEDEKLPKALMRRFFLANLRDNRVFYWLYEKDKQSVGFISLHINFLIHHAAAVAEIQELVVLPEFQNNNIGGMLIETACETAKNMKCELIEVACNRRRTNAHFFYEKNGFEKTHFKFVKKF